MSLPVFKDIDKCVKDLFTDDFDCTSALKVKTAGPFGVSVTTTTDVSCCGVKALGGKISTKWAHDSGFAVEKFELKSNGGVAIETSLSGVAPGLKFDFKGDDSNKAELSTTYKHELATATAEVDVAEFRTVKASVLGGNNKFNAGAAVGVCLGDKFDVSTLDVAATYKLDKFLTGFSVTEKLAKFGVTFGYFGCPKYSSVAQFTFVPESSTLRGFLIGTYKCNPNTQVKVKANCQGDIGVSLKQNLDKNASLVAAVGLNASDISAVKYGVTLTLG